MITVRNQVNYIYFRNKVIGIKKVENYWSTLNEAVYDIGKL